VVTPEPLIPASDPLYEQAAAHIRNEIISGRLQSGDRLPPIRKYAEKLGVSRLTVHRAYSLLSDEGIVVGHPGSGTFVAQLNNRELSKEYLGKFAVHGPMIEFEQICRQAQIRSFATPIPDGSLVDLQDYFAYQLMLSQENTWNLNIAEWGGESELRRAFVPWFKQLGVDLQRNEIVINTGSSALDLFVHYALDPCDTILVDEPWGILFTRLMKHRGVRAIGIDPSRICAEELAELVDRESVQAVLACPHYGFATGIGWSDSLLNRLYEIARVKNIQLLFTLGFGLLPHTAKRILPPAPNGVNIWYGISLPFLTAGALQASAMSIPNEMSEIVRGPESGPEGMTRIAQLAMARYLDKNFQRHLEKARHEFAQRSNRLYHALRSQLNGDIDVLRADGGHGMTLRLPKTPDASALFDSALAENVAIVPNEFICLNSDNFANLRLLFNNIKLTEIDDAAERLARAINRTLA